jgi:hypothetical protein
MCAEIAGVWMQNLCTIFSPGVMHTMCLMKWLKKETLAGHAYQKWWKKWWIWKGYSF